MNVARNGDSTTIEPNKKSVVLFPLDLGMVKAFAVRGEKTVLIDTGMPENRDLLLQKLREHGIQPAEISLVIVTHGHYDHFGNARYFQETVGAKILVHQADAEAIRTGFTGFPRSFNFLGEAISIIVRTFHAVKSLAGRPEAPAPAEPDILIDGDYDLMPHGISGRIIPTPGHTPGGISVILNSGDAIVGDLIGSIVKQSRPSIPLWGNDLSQLRKSIKKVMDCKPSLIHAAHVKPFKAHEFSDAFSWLKA